MQPQIRFCRTVDGLRIAYAITGTGTPIVRVLGWLTHLEFIRNGPLRWWAEELARRFQVVEYDGRGVGLSDRNAPDFTLEHKLLDVEAVMDAAGLASAVLVGTSEGGATAIAYAVRHPERVRRLILCEATAHAGNAPLTPEALAAITTLVREGWGQDNPAFRQLFTDLFYPDAGDEFARWFNELQRHAATPEAAARYWESAVNVDVRHLLARVTVPTLVIHRRGDLAIPVEAGREMAASIPGARLALLDGRNHIPLPGEPECAEFVRLVAEFVGERPEQAPRDAPSRAAALSAREREVLRLLAEGQSNQRIAEMLVISPNTVVRHVSNIFAKLGTANRTETAARAKQLGLLD